MTTDDTDHSGAEHDTPSLRQRLHSATGDREAEASALADRAGDDVTEEDARTAVRRAHGDLGPDQPSTESDLASPDDARTARDDATGEAGAPR